MTQHPGQEHRHERPGQQVGGDHREADGQRERDEKIARRPLHQQGGMKTATTHSIASKRGMAAVAPLAARATEDVLPSGGGYSRPRRSPSTRMPTDSASPPRVMRLIDCPVSHRARTAPQERKGNVEHDDDDAAPVAQEQQHHEPGQDGPERPSAARP